MYVFIPAVIYIYKRMILINDDCENTFANILDTWDLNLYFYKLSVYNVRVIVNVLCNLV